MTESTGIKQWNASWIWKAVEFTANEFAYFRKSIFLKDEIVSAAAYVSAHNHYELYINAHRTGGYVSPAPSHPQKGKLYLTYDISALLSKGTNVLCSIVHYIGGQGQNYVDAKPGFVMQINLQYSDGTCDEIVTDETWICLGETGYKNRTEFQQNRRISAIESYDARREPQGWMDKDFDDSGWQNAVPSAINMENWFLKPQMIPEGAIDEIIVPKFCGLQEAGWQVFDAGKIITGWPRFALTGYKGTHIRMRYSEDLDDAGRVKHNVCNEDSDNYYDEYYMQGEAVESWEPRFSYKAFRYLEITGYPCLIEPGEIRIVAAHTELKYEGSFTCSNQLLNQIYKACVQTQKNNIAGQMTDCPHREQAQYLADSDLQAETFGYNFLNPTVLSKVLTDFKDAQLENGTFPFVFPSNYDCPDFNIRIPEWDLHYCTLLWKTYFLYGDKEILKEFYATARRLMDYYIHQIDKEKGLVPKSRDWHISDWPYPKVDHKGAFLTVQNCKIFNNLNIMGNISEILGYEKVGADYREKAAAMKGAILEHLYDRTHKRFYDSYGVQSASQAANVIAFHYGLAPEGDRDHVLQYIVEKGLDCSTLVSMSLLRVLFENGKQDTALSILTGEEAPGWGYMVQKGYSTVWEGFEDIESHCHAWNAYPARMLMEYVTGIRAIAPGFERVEIRPYMTGLLEYAEAEVPTIRGKIHVKWYREGTCGVLHVELPEGTRGKLILEEGEVIREIMSGSNSFVIK